MCKNRKQTGSTILEVIVAAFIVGTVLTGIASLLSNSVKNTTEAENRKVATRLAQDAMELYRKEKYMRTWAYFTDTAKIPEVSGTNWYCIPGGVIGINASYQKITNGDITGCAAITIDSSSTSFYRAAQKNTASGVSEVTVKVSWKDGTAVRSVDVQQNFKEVAY